MKLKNKIFFSALFFVLIIGISFVTGFFVGNSHGNLTNSFLNKSVSANEVVDLSEFWKVWELINEKFMTASSTEGISDQQKVWGAIKGMVDSLADPYTTFLTPEELKEFETSIKGQFEGVGMELGMKDNVLNVVAPLKNSPAEKAGVKAGDKIVRIGDLPTTGFSIDKAVSLIRGKKGTDVSLTLLREGDKEPIVVTITRDVIVIPVIETQLRPDDVFVIRLFNFNANASKKFESAFREFIASKKDKLIIDLRGNPGGYLNAAVDVASWFIPKGQVVVTEDSGKGDENKVYRSKGYVEFKNGLPKVVVLVNGGSASASEIVAGALKDYKIATLIGENTYGKGSVQQLIDVTPKTSLKITIAHWLTPNGDFISDGGLKPDYEIKYKEEKDRKDYDNQIEGAANFLKTGKID